MKKILFVLLLSGCTTISHNSAPEDRPFLRIIEPKYKSTWQVIKYCHKYLPLYHKLLGSINLACAEINLLDMTCTVHRYGDAHKEHEYQHCNLQDHSGSSVLRDLWSNWKTSMTASGSSYYYIRYDGQLGRIDPSERRRQ